MRPWNAALVTVWAIAVAGCAQQNDNPFGARGQMEPPPKSAALLFTSGRWSTSAGAGREVYAVNADGSGLIRLTYCNTESTTCDNLEVAPSSDRKRIIARRTTSGDPSEAIVFADLARGIESTLVPSTRKVSSIEWAPFTDYVFYSGLGQGGRDDIYRIDYNGLNDSNVTVTSDITERDVRMDPSLTQLAMTSADATGLAVIERITTTGYGGALTTGGTPGEPLTGLPWTVGSDADPAYSPSSDAIVFRRCTGRGADGLGTWDILTITETLGTPAVVAAGPLYRSEPDWGPDGISFFERDLDAGVTRLILVAPDGTNRRVLVEQAATVAMGPPRFLPTP